MDLGNLKQIARLDKENMLDLLVAFPRQCRDALFIAEHAEVKKDYKRKYSNIIFTGLGGSAIGADLVKDYVSAEINIPIFVNRDYTLPKFVNKDSLVFAVSYSGNTEETLSAYSEAKEKRATIVAITSGGKLKERASKNKDMFISIPKGYPPRCALGYTFIPTVIALSRLGLIKKKNQEVRDAVEILDALVQRHLAPHIEEKSNVAKEIARRLYKKFPVIYASNKIAGVATRWRGQFAENAKTLSSAHLFPEMNHNEIMGWENPRFLLLEFVAVVLKNKDDYPRVKKRIRVTASILKKEKFDVLEVEAKGKTFLERMLSLIYIGDFASFYLSIMNKTDPTPVDRITYLKKQLAK
jgi:glucose/mannose-6-phosphate isomerase